MGTILYVNSSKKYDEWLADNTDFFSNLETDYDVTVDAGTQDLIELFFGNRFVCDDDNFERYYKRTLINTWDRYVDLLRIEKTEIDPLVADYFENQLVHTGEMTGAKSGSTSSTTEYGKTDTLTHNVTVTEDNEGTVDESKTLTHNVTVTEDNSISTDETNTLTHNVTVTEDNTITNDETNTRTLDLANDNTRTNDLADSHTRTDDLASSNTRTDNLANSNTRTDNLTTTTDNKQAGANAVNPQSIEYSGATAGSLPSLDWQYMSNQEQTEGEGTEHKTGTVQDSGTQTGTVRDQGTNTGTVTTAGSNTGTITDEGTETGTDTLVTDGDKVEDKERHTTGTETTVLDKGVDEDKERRTTGTETTVTDRGTTEDKIKTTTGTDTHALTGEDEVTGSTSESTSGTDTHTDRERHTGRTGILPQEALRKAKAYIQKSRAFDWLKDELEPCFISIYDI